MTEKKIAERYRLQDELGAGGMGTVYRGLDTVTGQAVAIKQLKPEIAQPETLERFKREGEALRDLNHPNIVKVLDAVEENGCHYLVMEYVSGGDLTKLMEKGQIPIKQVLTLAIDLADALTRAHKLNIIHRDLKPANVLIAEDGTLRLTDFGVAHVSSKARVTATDAIVGTIDYLPPEIFSDYIFDARGDIWAFGVILFEMLAGERPFPGQTMLQVIQAITTNPLPDLEARCSAESVALVDLVYRMLEKDPQARIRSVRLVGAELEAILLDIDSAVEIRPVRFVVPPEPPPVYAENSPLVEQLTERETEILGLLGEGLSDREIAHQLVIELSTVKWHNRQIYSKLGVSSRQEAVIRAKELGLIAQSVVSIPAYGGSNLPVQTTPFVGREVELEELTRLLEDTDVRLVSIVASGGMGKSRLALAAAEKLIGEFVSGVFFVELAPLTDPDHIPAAIADAVGYPFQQGGRDPKQQILDYLSNKALLLVLDNFEHLSSGVGLVTDILKTAPHIHILVTSRERLNQTGETVYNLSGMDVPRSETPRDAQAYAAVKLFMQSARRVQPQFELTPDNAGYIVRICRLVEGIPLGILLAAGWISMLSPQEIAAETAQSFDFLETDLRDIPERQRSIRSVFDYSWNLMDGTEQDTFQRLAVFRGGFTRQAAQTVTGASLKTLTRLVNKSLLRRDPDTGRFGIHELLRQYAENQLEAAGEAEAARDNHSAYYAGVLCQYEPALQGKPQVNAGVLQSVQDAIQTQYDATRPQSSTAEYSDPLTDREIEVLQLVAAGLSNRDIAQELVLSIGTVKTHLNRIFSKLNVKSRTQAIIQGRTLNLLPG
ncbi:MAG: protein kinase [Anaerolineae bacterium]|nr:protein kinase [Anaerolineae bacterium]